MIYLFYLIVAKPNQATPVNKNYDILFSYLEFYNSACLIRNVGN